MFGQTLDASFIYFYPALSCLSLAYIHVNLISYFREKITVRTRPTDIGEQSLDTPLFGNADIIVYLIIRYLGFSIPEYTSN